MNGSHLGIKLSVFFLLCSVCLQGCFLFPSPVNPPNQTDSFTPTLVWVQPTFGPLMDVSPVGNIVSIGERTNNGRIFTAIQTFNAAGSSIKYAETAGISKEVVANYSNVFYNSVVTHIPIQGSSNYTSLLGAAITGAYTNPYTRYNSFRAALDVNPYPWSGYVEVVGPSIAKGTRETPYLYQGSLRSFASVWMVGSFYDKFQPYPDDGSTGSSLESFRNSCPTFGKADCFIMRVTDRRDIFHMPVRHQWGGPENDLAYDVASDDIGNATIFLRAGSDFGITSATQSLVRMKTGYNIVRLDTNGLLTETFPVSLGATGELTDTQIALGKNGAVYILAKDEQRKQYFLAKVSSSGTAWTRYLPASVSDRENSVPVNRTARMGLTVDSKDCAYITGNFSGTVDFGGVSLTSGGVQVFVAKYSASGSCLGALAMGSGLGVTVRLSPDETALYVNGWAVGSIMGTSIPDQNDERNGVLRPGAFLVKLKTVK